jgi:hypothetical protein
MTAKEYHMPTGWERSYNECNDGIYIKIAKKLHFTNLVIIVAKAKYHPQYTSDNLINCSTGEGVHEVPKDVDHEEIIVTLGQNSRSVMSLLEFYKMNQAVEWAVHQLTEASL